jgi:hypothetical protein
MSCLSAQAQDRTQVLFGRVVADATGAALPRVRVAALADGRTALEPVFTDEQGWFSLDVPPGSMISLTAFKAGFTEERHVVPMAARPALTPLVVRVARAGAITGRLVDTAGAPAYGAEVRVRRVDPGAPGGELAFAAVADDRGVYRVGGLRPGEYDVIAGEVPAAAERASTYARLTETEPRLRAWLVTIPPPLRGPTRTHRVTVRAEGEAVADVQVGVRAPSGAPAVEMPWPVTGGGALAGVVTDEYGDPVAGVRVEAVRVGRAADAVAPAAIPAVLTDDRGAYRMFGLPSGPYVVRVSTDAIVSGAVSRADQGLAPVYFPGIPSPGWATPVAVRAGREETSIDAVLSPSLAARISGRVVAAPGTPVRGTVRLLPATREWAGAADRAPVAVRADGTFVFVNVPPGDYVVRAAAEAGADQPSRSGAGYVSVLDGDPPPLTITVGSDGGTRE